MRYWADNDVSNQPVSLDIQAGQGLVAFGGNCMHEAAPITGLDRYSVIYIMTKNSWTATSHIIEEHETYGFKPAKTQQDANYF